MTLSTHVRIDIKHIKTTSAGNDPNPDQKKKELQGLNAHDTSPKVRYVTAALSRLWEAGTTANLHPHTEKGEGDINSGWCCGDDIIFIARIFVLVCRRISSHIC